jgi:hypothetical protein
MKQQPFVIYCEKFGLENPTATAREDPQDAADSIRDTPSVWGFRYMVVGKGRGRSHGCRHKKLPESLRRIFPPLRAVFPFQVMRDTRFKMVL